MSGGFINRLKKTWWLILIIGVIIGLAVGLPVGGKTLFRDTASDMGASYLTANSVSLAAPENSAPADITVYVGQTFEIRPVNTYYVQYYDSDFLAYVRMDEQPWNQSSYQWVHYFQAVKATGAEPTVVNLVFPTINGYSYGMAVSYRISVVEKGEMAIYRAFPNSRTETINDTCSLSEVKLFAFNWQVEKLMICNGASLPVAGNEALFQLLGNKYGGDGSANFAIPNQPGLSPDYPLSDLTYQICVAGAPPPGDAGPPGDGLQYCPGVTFSDYYLGEIVLAKDVWDQADWLIPCDGRTLSIGSNQALFALVGTAFGGDGMNYFAVPDLSGMASPVAGASYYIVAEGTFPTRS